MTNRNVKEAMNDLIASFSKHSHLFENGKINSIEALQEFWNMKFKLNYNVAILYEYLDETSGAPYICTVTLPGGACFATANQNCATKSEAKQSAALIALWNSVLNEHPSRQITPEYIQKAVNSTARGMEVYRNMLELNMGKNILEFQQMMAVFQLLQWNGSFKAMKKRNCTRQEVILYYRQKTIDEEMRLEISLDWIVREQECPGRINAELAKVNGEIDEARRNANELRCLKEKRDILLLALYQLH